MKEKSGHRLKVSSKTKKPDQQTYVIPSARANDDAGLMFTLEYEDADGDVHWLKVHKTDDIAAIARLFGHQRHLEPHLVQAMIDFLQQERTKRL